MNDTLNAAAKRATAIRLAGDAKSRPIDVGSLDVALGRGAAGRDSISWTESGTRHFAPIAAVIEIITEEG